MSKVDTLRHAVDYIEKLQTILIEQRIDVNVSTLEGRENEEETTALKEDTSSSISNETSLSSQSNSKRPQKQNNRSRRNITALRENKSITPKCASRANLPPPLIMLPKSNQQSLPLYHQPHHQPSPTTPSSSSACSSPSMNSPLLGLTNNQTIMNFNHNNTISSNQQNYPPPLTPRTPSNSSGMFLFYQYSV